MPKASDSQAQFKSQNGFGLQDHIGVLPSFTAKHQTAIFKFRGVGEVCL